MGSISAKKLGVVVENTAQALAIELMVACAGIDQRRPHRPSRGVRAAHGAVRERVTELVADRPLYKDVALVRRELATGELVRAVEAAVGTLA